MLTSPTALRDGLVGLDNDVSLLPGRRVALLGFRDPNAKRIDENLRVLRATAGWTVVDVRSSPEEPVSELLARALTAPKLALVVDATAAIPTDAALLIGALHDSRDAVRWANGAQVPLPAQRILYVIASGSRGSNELPPLLARLDFMDFIKAP